MVCIKLFKNGHRLTSRHIDSFTRDIERHVAVHTDTRESGYDFSRVSVKNYKLRRFTSGGKQSMIRFVQSYRMSYVRVRQRPSSNQLTSV